MHPIKTKTTLKQVLKSIVVTHGAYSSDTVKLIVLYFEAPLIECAWAETVCRRNPTIFCMLEPFMLCNFIFVIVLRVVLTISPLAIAARYVFLKAYATFSQTGTSPWKCCYALAFPPLAVYQYRLINCLDIGC